MAVGRYSNALRCGRGHTCKKRQLCRGRRSVRPNLGRANSMQSGPQVPDCSFRLYHNLKGEIPMCGNSERFITVQWGPALNTNKEKRDTGTTSSDYDWEGNLLPPRARKRPSQPAGTTVHKSHIRQVIDPDHIAAKECFHRHHSFIPPQDHRNPPSSLHTRSPLS